MQDIFAVHTWKPLEAFGYTHPFWSINIHTIYYTWVVMGAMIALIIGARWAIRHKRETLTYIIMSFVDALRTLCTQTMGRFDFNYFSFIASLFVFILLCNLISLIPGLEEPTSDLSTTFALGIISLAYVQYASFRSKSLWGFLFEILMPLNLAGELGKVLSISFRLYGNIFGGVVISKLYMSAIGGVFFAELAALLSGINLLMILFFVLFAGVIQAFVFSMLSLTYLTIATHNAKE